MSLEQQTDPHSDFCPHDSCFCPLTNLIITNCVTIWNLDTFRMIAKNRVYHLPELEHQVPKMENMFALPFLFFVKKCSYLLYNEILCRKVYVFLTLVAS